MTQGIGGRGSWTQTNQVDHTRGKLFQKKLSSGVISTMANSRQKRAQQGVKKKKGKGALVERVSGGTSITMTQTPVVPRSYMTKMNNSEIVRVSNTEVLLGAWPVSTGTFGVSGRYMTLFGTLAWANVIGQNFSLFRFKKLCFHYKPIVGTTAAGYFALAFVSDPEDVTSIDTFTQGNALSRMANCRRFVQVPVWQECSLEIKPGDFTQDWYVYENSSITDQATARQCSAGGFFIAAQATDTAATGIVYVSYELELKDPVSAFANR